ncbi:hypothetical protein D3C78_386330 [compost metagenome]
MQGGVGNGDAADKHRFELGHRGDGAGTAHLELDVLQQGHLLFCRELVGRGPARGPGHETELLLQRYVVHLVDHAVDLVGQLAAAGQDVVVEGLATGRPLLELHLGTERQPPGLELVEASEVGVPQLVAAYAHAIGVEAQGTAGGDAGIELAQAAGGGVARVDEHLLPCRQRLGIHRLETGLGHEDFATHLQSRRPTSAPQDERNGLDGAHILGDLLPRGAIAPGGRLHQLAVHIEQADRQTIQLGLAAEGEAYLALEAVAHALLEGLQLFGAEDVVQAQHGDLVAHLAEGRERLAADPHAGGGRGFQLGVLGLECNQLAHQAIVFGVRHRGVIQHIVLMTIFGQQLTQLTVAGEDVAHEEVSKCDGTISLGQK